MSQPEQREQKPLAYCNLCGEAFELDDSFDLEIYCPRHRSKKNRDADRGKTIEEQDKDRAKGFEKTLDPIPDKTPQDSRAFPPSHQGKFDHQILNPTTYLAPNPTTCRFCRKEIAKPRRRQ